MRKTRKTRILKDLKAYSEARTTIHYFEAEIEKVQADATRAMDNLYELRPKEYIKEVIECCQELLTVNDESYDILYIDEILVSAKDMLNNWDKYKEDSVKYLTKAQRRRRGLK